MKKISTLLENLFTFFYPRLCVSCNNALREKEQFFCLHCHYSLPETKYHLLDHNPLIFTFMGRVDVDYTASYLFYRKGNHVQHILQEIKYKGNKELGEFLGYNYAIELKQDKIFEQIDLILPIPLHKKKEKRRGYNQSEWIAKGLSKGLERPYLSDVLVRVDFTETQTKKSRFNRWENVKNVFQVQQEELIKNKHVLVCDDVLTTGATMEAALKELIKVEGVKVSVVTLAVTG
jgi:ComF family protein